MLPTRTVSVYTVRSLLGMLGHFTLVTVLSVGSIIFLISWTAMAGFLCSSGAHLPVMKQTSRGVGSSRGTASSSAELRRTSWMRRCLSRVLVARRKVWVELVGIQHTRKGNSPERGGWQAVSQTLPGGGWAARGWQQRQVTWFLSVVFIMLRCLNFSVNDRKEGVTR